MADAPKYVDAIVWDCRCGGRVEIPDEMCCAECGSSGEDIERYPIPDELAALRRERDELRSGLQRLRERMDKAREDHHCPDEVDAWDVDHWIDDVAALLRGPTGDDHG